MNVVSTDNVNRATSAFLLGVSIVQVIASLKTSKTEANAIGAAVCIIAYMHYRWMEGADSTKMLELRYSDWIVTCPLLLWELQKMSGQKSKQALVWPVILVTIMLMSGFASKRNPDPRSRLYLFTIGCVAFALCVLSSVHNVEEQHLLVYAFFGIWSLYPLASWTNNNVMLSILDMISKGGFGLYIATNAFENENHSG